LVIEDDGERVTAGEILMELSIPWQETMKKAINKNRADFFSQEPLSIKLAVFRL
jgi:hypothetical protein